MTGARLVTVAVLTAALLAGVVSSTPQAGTVLTAQQQAVEFDVLYENASAWFQGERDEKATFFVHQRLLNRTDDSFTGTDSETDFVRYGRGENLQTYSNQRLSQPNFYINVLHPPGSVDYAQIGDRYRLTYALTGPGSPPGPLVGTPWVQRPALLSYERGAGWDACVFGPTAAFCEIDSALRDTRTAVPDLPRQVVHRTDGTVELRTGIRLIDLITQNVVGLNGRALYFAEPLLNDLVPYTIVFRPDGTLASAELHGAVFVPGVFALVVQTGYAQRGRSTAHDIPPVPSDPPEITVMTSYQWSAFSTRAGLVRGRPDLYPPLGPPRS